MLFILINCIYRPLSELTKFPKQNIKKKKKGKVLNVFESRCPLCTYRILRRNLSIECHPHLENAKHILVDITFFQMFFSKSIF